eukprot:gene16119-7475_t
MPQSCLLQISKWTDKTGFPTVALTLYHDKSQHLHVKFTGHPFFHEFMDDPYVKKNSWKLDPGIEDSIIDTFLKEDIQSFQVDSKRKLIGAAVLGKDLKKRKMWREEYRPKNWWPENLPFRSPNAAPKFDVRELDDIPESCSRYIQSKSEHHTGDMAAEGRQAEEVIEDMLELADASLVGEKNINLWLRHLVPDELRDAGKEPISVKADGTCMFCSISVAIYGNEDSWCFIKLQALTYGTLHFDDVIERFMYDLKFQRIDQGCGSLCHQITDSATFNECSQLRDPVERLKACALAEIV